MNIDRVANRVTEVGIRRTESPSRPFDLTVSDRGVEERTQPAPELTQSTITSTPEMQSVLSTEETRALQAAFFTSVEGVMQLKSRLRRHARGVFITCAARTRSAALESTSGAMLDITG